LYIATHAARQRQALPLHCRVSKGKLCPPCPSGARGGQWSQSLPLVSLLCRDKACLCLVPPALRAREVGNGARACLWSPCSVETKLAFVLSHLPFGRESQAMEPELASGLPAL